MLARNVTCGSISAQFPIGAHIDESNKANNDEIWNYKFCIFVGCGWFSQNEYDSRRLAKLERSVQQI